MVEYDSPSASSRITRARRASSARIFKLRTRRSSSARSSTVNVSAIWRQTVPVLLQSVQATSEADGQESPDNARPARQWHEGMTHSREHDIFFKPEAAS